MRLRIALLTSVLLALFLGLPSPAAAKAPPPDAALAPQVMDAVVRIDVGGHFSCTGVVVTPEGHVLATGRSLTGYQYSTIAVGPAHVPATVVIVDPKHDLIVLKASTPLPRWARLDTAQGPAKDDPARVIAYVSKNSDPPMVELKHGAAKVETPHFSGDSANDMDLSDLLIVKSSYDQSTLRSDGSPVFSSKNGRLLGIVIGKMDGYSQTNRLILMPASTVRTLLESKKITVPAAE